MLKKILLFCLIFIFVGIDNSSAYKQVNSLIFKKRSEKVSDTLSYAAGGDFFAIESEDTYISHGEEIQIRYSFPNISEGENVQISYSGHGFITNNSAVVVSSIENYIFSFNCIVVEELKITLTFSYRDETNESSIFVNATELNDYVSINSFFGCKQQEYLYKKSNDLITENEYNQFVYGDEERVIIEEDSEIIDPKSGKKMIRKNANNSDKITIKGNINWLDTSDKLRPARKMRVEIWDYDPIFNDKLAETYSDEKGEYSIEVKNNTSWPEKGYDIYVNIVLSDGYFEIDDGLFTYSYCPPETYYNCGNGTELTISEITFSTNSKKSRDQAVSAHQATTWGFDYLDMVGAKKTDLTIRYPSTITSNSCYDNLFNIMWLRYDHRDHWEIIMHELGHFAADPERMTNYPLYSGGSHALHENQTDKHGKFTGPALAWSEGFANYFSVIVRVKMGLSNRFYYGEDIESSDKWLLGDGNEWVIARLLWDLQDEYDNGESWDNISWGHIELFNKIKKAVPKDTADFLQNLSDFIKSLNISPADEAMGKLLTYYQIAAKPNNPTAATIAPPIFTWVAQGGSVKKPNNIFTINIMNPSGEVIYTKNVGSATSHQITQADWDKIVTKYYGYIKWNVKAEQHDGWGNTGPYLSETLNLNMPTVPITQKQIIKPIDYNYDGQYYNSQENEDITLPNGFKFATTRLRTGFIENKYLVLSSFKTGAGLAYLEYSFNTVIDAIDFDLSLWAKPKSELISSANTTVKLEYKDANGKWIVKNNFDVDSMSLKENPAHYAFSFAGQNVKAVRFIVTSSGASGTNNKGRVVLGDLNIQY